MVTRRFEWRRQFSDSVHCQLSDELLVPLQLQSVGDLLAVLCTRHNVPEFARDSLLADLREFVSEATDAYFREQAEDCRRRTCQQLHVDTATERVCEAYQSVKTYDQLLMDSVPTDPDDAEQLDSFQQSFVQLLHSPKAQQLMQLECCMARQVAELLAQSRQSLHDLTSRQQRVMEEAVQLSGSKYTDDDINQLNKQHIANHTSECERWQAELVLLRDRQRAAYRQVVESQLDPRLLDSQLAGLFDSLSLDGGADDPGDAGGVVWEESFTITVGTQLKTGHNLRLVSADLHRLLRHTSRAGRLQTALGLYSDSLAAHLLLASRDQAFNPPVSADRSVRLKDVCESSADFHFDDISRQVELVASCVGGDNGVGGLRPRVGDVFITRHSNLNGAHVLFHLVAESGDCPELTSQHPVVAQGLRRVVRTALASDINTLTLPLLLTNQLTEEMTIGWCQRRAELVLKTIKGFLVEYITWQSHRTPRCFQFLVPPGLSDSMLTSFSSTIQSIFNLSNAAKHL